MTTAITQRLIDNSETLRQRLTSLPQAPGVYIMKDADGNVIYVGKAVNLRDRVSSYFTQSAQASLKVSEIVNRTFDFEVIKCENEVEALVLECNLIKFHRPRYNIRLKDAKNYLYIRIPFQDDFPQVSYSRSAKPDGATYFGPYTSAESLRQVVKTLRQMIGFRTCSDQIFKRSRVCLDFYMHRCPGPCEGRIKKEAYREGLQQVALILSGHFDDLTRELRSKMKQASDALKFEEAAKYRDILRAIDKIAARQKVVSSKSSTYDVLALARIDQDVMIHVSYIRDGRMIGGDNFLMESTSGEQDHDVLRAFILNYYSDRSNLPPEILIPYDISDAEALSRWLSEKVPYSVRIYLPQKGPRRALLLQAIETAKINLEQQRLQRDAKYERSSGGLKKLAEYLGLEAPPKRIECYDISNIQGTSATGSMVVMEAGQPLKQDYRIFHIKLTKGPDDFAMMREVLLRRFSRLERALRNTHKKENGNDSKDSFAKIPDLVLIDGGKGQLSAAVDVLQKLGFGDIPVFALAKKHEEIFAPGSENPIVLDKNSSALFLLQRIRDEAHRFALTHHRRLRAASSLASPLDSVKGIGPRRKKLLMSKFGSLNAIKDAPIDELTAVGLSKSLAFRVKEVLQASLGGE